MKTYGPMALIEKGIHYGSDDVCIKECCLNVEKHRLPRRPSASYIETIWQGYVGNNLNIEIFEKSLEINSIECM